MKLLQELNYENDVAKMNKLYAKLDERATALKAKTTTLISEGLMDDHNGPLEREFDEISNRLAAAKKGLGLANKLRTPEERRMHKGRILGNMNRIRKMLYDIMLQLGVDETQPERVKAFA